MKHSLSKSLQDVEQEYLALIVSACIWFSSKIVMQAPHQPTK